MRQPSRLGLGLVVLGLGIAGCARRQAPPAAGPVKANPAAPASSAAVQEILTSSLPRGRLPVNPGQPLRPAKSDTLPGITVDTTKRPTRLSGVKDSDGAFNVELRDLPDAGQAYCVGVSAPSVASGAEPVGDRFARPFRDRSARARGTLAPPLWFAIPLTDLEVEIHAERLETAGPPRLSAILGLATSSGGVRKLAETTTLLAKVGEMAGVEVFAFVEDVDPVEAVRPSSSKARSTPPPSETVGATAREDRPQRVQLVIRRPPLRNGSVQYVSFLVTDPTGLERGGACSLARVGLPVERGDGATASILVGVENELGARPLRVQVSTLWLKNEATSRLGVRFTWAGATRDHLVLSDGSVGTPDSMRSLHSEL